VAGRDGLTARGKAARSAGRRGLSAGYFCDDSMLRRVNRERVLALAGPRALLMQAAHPLAVAGLLAHSTALEEPYDRLARTAQVLDTIAFGSRRDADRVTARVRAMHKRVRGRLPAAAGPYPAGTPYRADDPELLLWVLFTLIDSGTAVYRKYVGALSQADEAALWDDYRVVGHLFGLRDRDMPADLDALGAYRRAMLEGDRLHVSDWARERARAIVLAPPVPLAARPLLEVANFVTIALLPDRIREQYGFSRLPPPFVRKALVAGGAAYVKRAVVPLLPERIRLVSSAAPPRSPTRARAAAAAA
jgi:uncharacterized protein (DUF2236 family)